MGAPVGEILEGTPGGEHERDHRAGEALAERERPRHRENGDEVHARLAAEVARLHTLYAKSK